MISIQTGAQAGPAATLDQPLEHLLACHRRIEERLETLERVVPFLWEHRREALAAIHNVFAFLDTSGALHTEDEEQSVFPRLSGRLSPAQTALVHVLESEHQEAWRLYGDLKSVALDIERLGAAGVALQEQYQHCATELCEHYREHIQTEEEQLCPLCRTLLDEEDLQSIAAEMKARRGVR